VPQELSDIERRSALRQDNSKYLPSEPNIIERLASTTDCDEDYNADGLNSLDISSNTVPSGHCAVSYTRRTNGELPGKGVCFHG